MARDPRYDILFEPVNIGPKTLPNRFVQSSHCNGAGSDRPGFQADFRAMKAEGGWGAVSTEYCAIAPETDDVHRVSARLWDEGDVRNLSLTCKKIHEHGALAAVEIWHGGSYACGLESRVPGRSPSQIANPFAFMRACKAMDKDDIGEVQQLYVDAAKRARDAGFDLIIVHGAHTTALPHLFLTPFYNRRTDEYGGSLENRARFGREVLELVRAAVGDDCAIACRFGVDTLDKPHGFGDRGVRADPDGYRFIELCNDLVDMWDINVGTLEWGEDAAPSRTHPENHEGRYTNRVKEHTDKPVMNVGRFVNPDTMIRVIRRGQCDIIGAARPSIADPFLPNKIKEGRLDDIRECIGCNVCISRWEIGGPPIICTQNATSAEEFRRGWHPERFTQAANWENDVLVLGAGPAGMECAMVLGRRGMRRVHLVDENREIGGHMRWVPELPGLGEWARVVNYRKIQLAKLANVEVITGARLDAASARDYGAEILIVATGAHWARDGLNGFTGEPIPSADASLPYVLTPEQIMVEGKQSPGESVLVYDCDGYFTAVGLAEKLAREGKVVTIATPFESLAPYTVYTLEAPRLNRTFHALGITVLKGQNLTAVAEGAATLVESYTEREQILAVDAVVLATQRNSDDALYQELKAAPEALAAEGVKALYQIGDCVAPWLIAEAVFSGHRLAREIDSPNPAVPLPYIRERRLLHATERDFTLPRAEARAAAITTS